MKNLMKKFLSILVAALLVFAPAALAQELAVYKNDPGKYQIGHPADWPVVDASTIDLSIAALQAGELQIDNVTDYLLKYIKDSMTGLGVDMMISFGPKNSRFNVIYQDLPDATQQGLIDRLPNTIEQCKSVYENFVPQVESEVKTYNGKEFVRMVGTYTYEEMPMLYCVCSHLAGTRLYIVTFTLNTDETHGVGDAEALVEQVLNSFEIV